MKAASSNQILSLWLLRPLTVVCQFLALACLLALPFEANSQDRCVEIFRSASVPAELFNERLAPGNFEAYKSQILEMAKKLVQENQKQLLWGFENRTMKEDLKPKIGDVFNFELIEAKEPWDYGKGFSTVGIKTNDPWGSTTVPLMIRTNGKVAFLAETFRLRRKGKAQKFRAVYFDKGAVRVVDQAEALLATLPEEVKMYRQMSESEKSKWSGNGLVSSRSFGWKIHFSPTHFNWNNQNVYKLKVPKSLLLKLYRNGELEINSYNEALGKADMPLSEAGIEFEIVVVGESGAQQILPYMLDLKLSEQIVN